MPQLIPHHAHIAPYAVAFVVTDVLSAGTWLAAVAWISDKAGALRAAGGDPGPDTYL